MNPIFLLVMCTLAFAGRAPYLGGDIEDLMEETKRSGVSNARRGPVTAQQRADYQRFNTKFTEIAKAYAEGYKAAIKAVQARALIAQKRLYQNRLLNNPMINARSNIPEAPVQKPIVRENLGVFNLPVPNELTVNGIEKSGIPRPEPTVSIDHKMVERSVPYFATEEKKQNTFYSVPVDQLSEEKRSEISRLNYAARHRNVYFDSAGGDPYTGGVLSRQNIIFKKHRKRSLGEKKYKSLRRRRRSHMPYLGQNLDALGIIRAKPNWDEPPKKKEQMPVPEPVQSQLEAPQPGSAPVYFQQPKFFDSNPSSFNPDMRGNFRGNVPAKPNYGQIQYNRPQLQQLQLRSNVPAYQFNQMQMQPQYMDPFYAGVVSETSPTIEEETPGVQRRKKSASPEPDVVALNYAGRHRNVYMDSVSGDPYSGGSSVLSKQNIIFKKH